MTILNRWRAVTAAYAVLIFVFSVIPIAPRLVPGQLDKVAHLCEYLVLAWFLAHALRTPSRPRVLWRAWWWATAYGAALELIQTVVPWRSADVMDGLTNAAGAALGVWISKTVRSRTTDY